MGSARSARGLSGEIHRPGLEWVLFTLLLGFFGRRFFSRRLGDSHSTFRIDPLDVGHRSGVAEALAQLDDAGVATLAIRSTGRDIGKEFFYGILLTEVSSGETAGVKITTLAKGDHFLGEGPDGLGFREGGLNAFVFDQAADLVREHGIAMSGGAAEFDGFFLVAHGVLAGGFFGDLDKSIVEFLTKTQAEWCELLEGSDACFAPVLDLDEARNHPHMKSRAAYVEHEGEWHTAPAPRFSRTPGAVRSSADDGGDVVARWTAGA